MKSKKDALDLAEIIFLLDRRMRFSAVFCLYNEQMNRLLELNEWDDFICNGDFIGLALEVPNYLRPDCIETVVSVGRVAGFPNIYCSWSEQGLHVNHF